MDVKFDFSDVEPFFEEIEDTILAMLIEAGENAITTAIESGTYQNITGNLRSSIGYVIAKDGMIIKEGGFRKIQGRGENYQKAQFTTQNGKNVSFWARGKSGDGAEGSKKGIEFARNLISKMPGFTIVVVAGMDYASYVNSKGLDVLDSAQIKVITMLQL